MKATPIIILIVCAALVVGGFFLMRQGADLPADDTDDTMVADAITVSDQEVLGAVTVDELTLSQNGFVVIHEDDNGAPGGIIGHAELLSAGMYENLPVPMMRAGSEGEKMWAMVHHDDGDGVFTFPGPDGPARDEGGNVVMVSFVVLADDEMAEDVEMSTPPPASPPAVAPPPAPAPPPPADPPPPTQAMTHTVEIRDDGFRPATISIARGDTVRWVNNSSRSSWPASDPHPIHTGYPEDGGCINSAFDACSQVRSGEEWSFTFDIAGEWGYHDHLNAALRGTVSVSE